VTDRIIIDFTPFTIPNVFTPYPSSPGYNDFFVIPNLPNGSRLQVFNRWGALVYLSDDYRNNWDANGLDAETYYYVIDTEDKTYKGYVTILRE
jgi:gliding motility-associated-like protein